VEKIAIAISTQLRRMNFDQKNTSRSLLFTVSTVYSKSMSMKSTSMQHHSSGISRHFAQLETRSHRSIDDAADGADGDGSAAVGVTRPAMHANGPASSHDHTRNGPQISRAILASTESKRCCERTLTPGARSSSLHLRLRRVDLVRLRIV
jgi:hypothetical protein